MLGIRTADPEPPKQVGLIRAGVHAAAVVENLGDLDAASQQLVAGSPQKDAMGAPDTAWADVATVYADVRNLSGRALFAAQEAQSEVTATIEIRYRAGVTAAMRAVHSGVVYDIKAVIDPDACKERLLLQCATGVNQG